MLLEYRLNNNLWALELLYSKAHKVAYKIAQRYKGIDVSVFNLSFYNAIKYYRFEKGCSFMSYFRLCCLWTANKYKKWCRCNTVELEDYHMIYDGEADIIDEIAYSEKMSGLFKKLSGRDLSILHDLLVGYKKIDVARKYCVSKSAITKVVDKIKKLWTGKI